MQPQTSAKRILVAEDDSTIRKLITTVLTDNGFEVLTANDGKAALALARRQNGPIDLLITDVMMPALDGFDLRERVLQERSNLPILIVSGALDPEIRGEDFPILRKPFSPDQLLSAVRNIMDATPQ